MLQNYVPSKSYIVKEYNIVFDDGHYNGFSFPCNEHGELLSNINEYAIANYRRCLEHPEKFVRFNKVIEQEYTVKDNAHGTCSCGNEVQLYDAYYGACQCEKCGKWYNLFGQELLQPEYWDVDPSEEDCWDY